MNGSKIKIEISRIVTAIIALLAVIGVFFVANKNVTQKKANLTSPEILRSLNYDQVTDGSDEEYVDEDHHILFSAFFTKDLDGDGRAEKILGSCNQIDKTDKLAISIGVNASGYLKDGVITITTKDGYVKNFQYQMAMLEDSVLNGDYVDDDVTTIGLKTIDAGVQDLIVGDIYSVITVPESYSSISQVTLNGTYVNEDEEEIPVSKTIDLQVDWYGTANTYVTATSPSYKFDMLSSDEDIVVKYTVTARTAGLITKENVITAEIPSILGYYPEVEYPELDESVVYDYDQETHILTISQESTSNISSFDIKLTYPNELYAQLDAKLSERASYNEYAQVSAYSLCHNNPNEEFSNPYRTATASTYVTINFYIKEETGKEFVAGMEIVDKDYLGDNEYGWSKNEFLDLYDSEESETYEYKIKSYAQRQKITSEEKTVTVHNGDLVEDFVDSNSYIQGYNSVDYVEGEIESAGVKIENGVFVIENDENDEGIQITVITNSQKEQIVIEDDGATFGAYNTNNFIRTTGLSFVSTTAIPTSGFIRVYNAQTDELIKEFTNGEWFVYNSDNPYTFEENVSRIKIETSEDDNTKLGRLEVLFTKEFDIDKMKQAITREELESISQFRQNIIFALFHQNVQGDLLNIHDDCKLYNTRSYSKISVSPDYVEVGEENANVKFTIDVPGVNNAYSKEVGTWLDGSFLVRIDKSSISDLKINNITTTNPNIKIVYYYLEKNNDDNYYYIRIKTENTQTEEVQINDATVIMPKEERIFSLKIDADVSINPMSASATSYVNLYSYNKALELYGSQTQDIYDLDDDGNENDYVGISTTRLLIVAPNNFRTTESVTNYSDDENEKEIFAPNVVEITKGRRQATINVQFVNGYNSDITNLKILGKIPYEGNTYVNGQSLKSTYSTTMAPEGVTISGALSEGTTIYYSEVDDPTDDVNDASNGWKLKEDVDNFKNIKTYLIVLKDGEVKRGQKYQASYNVEIPENIASNEVAYACFKASFDVYLNGLLNVEIQPGKLGLRMVQKYDIDLNKYKKETTHKVSGAIFSLIEEDEDGNEANEKIITVKDGKIEATNLRVNQVYYLKEIDGGNYETKEGTIKFKVVNDVNDELKLEILQGSTANFDDEVTFTKNLNDRYVLTSTIENAPKVKLALNKIDQETNERIAGVNFILINNGTASLFTTKENEDLELILTLDEEYTLKEYPKTGYYKIDDITFKVTKTNEGYKIISSNESFAQATVTNGENSDYIDTSITIENEKIPTYDLQIKKVDKDKNVPLEGVKFLLEKTDDKISKYYTTDENGIIDISDLYEYIEGKNITGKYTLQEVSGKNGYLLNDEKIEFYVTRGFDNILQIHIQDEENKETISKVTTTEEKVTLTITNSPLFKLIKINDETKEKLANVQFILYVLDEDGQEEDFAKDIYGEYVGVQNSNGEYILTTNENGEIALALPNGDYKIVEYSFLDGYQDGTKVEYFSVTGNTEEEVEQEQSSGTGTSETKGDIHISYIENLVDWQRSGKTYSGYNIYLDRDLDFEDAESYKNPNSTSYGDLNGNGIVETIKDELTNHVDGCGFTPIGTCDGNFNGLNHEIKNIYINIENTDTYNNPLSCVGLFSSATGGTIKNLGVQGQYIVKNVWCVGGIVGNSRNLTIENCHSDVDMQISGYGRDNYMAVSGIVSSPNAFAAISYGNNCVNCYNTGNISVESTVYVYAYGVGSYAERCYNTGDITVVTSGESGHSFVYGVACESATNCYNRGNISARSEIEAKAYGVATTVVNSYNTGDVEAKGTASTKAVDAVGSTVTNGYYLSTANISEAGRTQKGTAKTSDYMQSIYFVNDLNRVVWSQDSSNVNNGYPVLKSGEELTTKINNIEDLVKLSMDVSKGYNYNGYTVTLERDLDFNDDNSYSNPDDESYGDINRDGTIESIKTELTRTDRAGFMPIGLSNSNSFDGNFDGQNHKIENLYINNPAGTGYVGLFGYTSRGATTFSNLNVTETITASSRASIGGLVAYGGSATNCSVTGTINAQSSMYVGGIVGQQGNVVNCYADVDITYTGTPSSGNITVAGLTTDSSTFSYNLGDIDIQTEYATNINVYGIAQSSNFGYNRGNINVNIQSATTMNVYGVASTVHNVYNTGNVEVTGTANTLNIDAVGSSVDNGYYRSESAVTGNNVTTKGTAKSESYMKQAEFVNDLKQRYWKIDASKNDGYPIFNEADKIITTEINYIEDLVDIQQDVYNYIDYSGYEIKLKRTLDFTSADSYRDATDTSYGDINEDGTVSDIKTELTTGKGFLPIGRYQNVPFRGTFNGQNNEIDNLHVSDRSYPGFFGCIENATIKNLTVKGEIEKTSSYANYSAGICGSASGDVTIENCTNYCNLSTSDYFYSSGGILGYYNGTSLKINSCKNYGNINGKLQQVGGIVGRISGTASISNCDNYGEIVSESENNSSYSIGGIVGESSSSLSMENCYNRKDITIACGYNIGGLIGNASNSISLKDSGNEGNITINKTGSSNYGYGGILGYGSTLNTTNCYNKGNITISEGGGYIGGIVGYGNYSTGTLNDSYNKGNISISESASQCYAGGLVGRGSYNLSNCYNEGNLTLTSSTSFMAVGGLLGEGGSSATIENSYNKGNITANSSYYGYVGGITGRYGKMSHCYNEGIITSTIGSSGGYIGGISGEGSTADYCYNIGNVTGNTPSTSSFYVGGIFGYGGNISNSYNTAEINATGGDLRAGGIVGNFSGSSVSKCYNIGPVTGTSGSSAYVGGIVGYGSSSSISSCYNTAKVSGASEGNNNLYVAGIVGYGSTISTSYNTGEIESKGSGGSFYAGGISGSGNVSLSYNTANINNTSVVTGSGYIGGITGSGKVNNAYNLGNIESNVATTGYNSVYVGGIAGSLYSGTNYVYNTGDVINNVSGEKNNVNIYTGPIAGYLNQSQSDVLVYLEDIEVKGENTNQSSSYIGEAKSDAYMKSNQMYDLIKVGAPQNWKHVSGQYPTLDLPMYIAGSKELTEVTIENTALKYKITTEIGQNVDGNRSGGTITGEADAYSSRKLVETLLYNQNSTQAIEITPDEGYQIVSVVINGKNYNVETSQQTSGVTIPAGYFENVQKNYNVVATFGAIEDIFTINKVDEKGYPVEGATFEIQEVDTREVPTNYVGEMIDDSVTHYATNSSNLVNEVIGTTLYKGNNNYYFVEQADGTYVSNNVNTYYSEAESYKIIDLTGKTGKYSLTVSATGDSYTYGYVKVTNSSTPITSSTTSGSFVSSRYNTTSTGSTTLDGGQVYYLHFFFNRGYANATAYNHKFIINSINVSKMDEFTPHFELEDGKYVAKEVNGNTVRSIATATIPIDLTDCTRKYNLALDITVNSGSGYVNVNEYETRTTSGEFTYGSRTITKVLDGGKMYYVHLTYSTNANTTGNQMSLNSINLTLNTDDFYNAEDLKTNSEGKLPVELKYGKYLITETEAPDGYILKAEPQTVVVGEGTDNNATFVNEKMKEVIAHYYVNGTGPEFNNEPVSVSMDEIYKGESGTDYDTWTQDTSSWENLDNVKNYLQFGPYKLLQRNGKYILPENYKGKFGINSEGEPEDIINVYYYYEADVPMGSFNLQMTKVQENDGTTLVEGSEFDVYKSNGLEFRKIATLVDQGNGLYSTGNVAIEDIGDLKLVIKETNVPEGYEAVEDIYMTLTVEHNEDENTFEVVDTTYGEVDFASYEDGKNIITGTIVEPLQELNYEVHYFKDNVEDSSLAETSLKAPYGSQISEYEDKTPVEYELDYAKALNADGEEVDLPLEIKLDESKNVINVYYKKIVGSYKFSATKVNSADNSIKVSGAEFTIYKVDGNNKTEIGKLTEIDDGIYESENIVVSQEGTINVSIEETRVPTEYKAIANITGTITFVFDEDEQAYLISETNLGIINAASKENRQNSINMTIEEPYEEFDYTVHYFYDGIEDTSRRVTSSSVFGSKIAEVPDGIITGYKKDRTEGLPLTIGANEEENVVNVYYVKDNFDYTVHYFYDGTENEDKKDTLSAVFGSTITDVAEKNITGYKKQKTENLPLTISENEEENYINVYYIKNILGYTIHYFYDGVEDESKVENKDAELGSEITEVPDKNITGYKQDRIETLPLTISANAEDNVVNVYYVKETEYADITVVYVDNLTGQEIIPSTTIPGIVGETYEVQRKDIPGFKIDEGRIPNETVTITSGGVTVTYTYIELRPYELEVHYIGGEVGVDEAKIAVEFGTSHVEGYTTNGVLKIDNIELTDLGTVTYTVYETETPEYCTTVVSESNPAIVELIKQLNETKNKYEFIANYGEIEGFKVKIDEENHKVIFEITTEKNEKYDLALQKFISSIDGTEITNREPKVLISADGKVTYVGNNEIEKISNKQQVTYTIRMYNESTVRAKGKQVVEYIPDGLVFVPDNETNKKFEWKMYGVGAEGKPFLTSNPEEAVIVVSNYLVDEKIKALDVENGEVSYLDIQAVFKVDETKLTSDDRIIENKVQITPNENDDNTENDVTTEKLYVKYFDLSIEKYIAEVNVNVNGNETTKQVGYDQKGQLVKVDVKRSEAPNTKLTVTYGLLIKNVGEIPGYATEITDYIPQNFELVNNNGEWIVNGNKAISTSLSNKLINPGESEVIEITFEWNLAEGEIGTRRNEAEITAYANDYDAEDVTKDNKDGEDILVTLKTGSQAIAGITIIAIFTSIVALGVFEIRRKI